MNFEHTEPGGSLLFISLTSGRMDSPDVNFMQNSSSLYPDLIVLSIFVSEEIENVAFIE